MDKEIKYIYKIHLPFAHSDFKPATNFDCWVYATPTKPTSISPDPHIPSCHSSPTSCQVSASDAALLPLLSLRLAI